MILIILIQRGKGGGLVGAFGGAGGNSAFGRKSTDVFVKITVVTTIIWFVACLGGRYILDMQGANKNFIEGKRTATPAATANESGTTAPATDAAAPATPATDAPAAAAPAANAPASPSPASPTPATPAPAPASPAPAAPAPAAK